MELGDPNLNLFSYTLKQGLGVSAAATQKNYQSFLAALSQQLQEKLKVNFTDDTKQNFLNVVAKEVADLPFTGILENHQIKGRYRRWILDDNYQLLFDAYIENKYSEDSVIKFIKNLKELTPKQPESGNLGQTWMLSGWRASGTDADVIELAKKTYQSLFNQLCEPEAKGIFLGGSAWEFLGSHHHLLILIYPDEPTTKQAAEFYPDWLDLLCCRHKIIWAFENSQQLKTRLVDNYNQIIAMKDLSQLNLKELQSAMGKLSNFAISLNYLELQLSTIKVNVEKYNKKLAEMQAKAHPADDLKFLASFIQNASQKYPRQIEKDLDNFRPCLEVLRSLTDTIRGTVEIRQAQSDRTFQTIVGIVGVGLGTGSMVASASAGFKEEIKEIAANPAINAAINIIPLPASSLKLVLGFSILSGALASFVTWVGIMGWVVIMGSRSHSRK